MDGKELYNWLRSKENLFDCGDMGCGMWGHEQVIDGYWRTRYLLNTETGVAYEIVGGDLKLKAFGIDDIDLESIEKFEYCNNANRLAAHYPFSIYRFKEGVAYVNWVLHPDGMYFMDEDGYGMEPCEEESIGAYIDTNCKILVKFQDMEDDKLREELYEVALKRSSEGERFQAQ